MIISISVLLNPSLSSAVTILGRPVTSKCDAMNSALFSSLCWLMCDIGGSESRRWIDQAGVAQDSYKSDCFGCCFSTS